MLTIVGKSRSGADVSQGSGFVLTPDGLGATNYHVLEGATQAIAECCGQRTFDIRSIEGADIDKDLVVFQLVETGHLEKPQNLPHVILGSSKNSIVGEKVIAVGSPQGLENTVSDGILSAVREYDAVRLLQITAPISPGSSGGPVFDATGQVIGVSTFQFEKGQNLNFAVAAEYLGPLREQRLHVSLAQFQSSMRQYERQKSSAAQPPQRETSSESSQPARAPLRGMFSGVVHNLSANLSAGFVVLVEETDGVLSGCMGVKQPLFGSGPLSGSVEGAEVSFDVVSATGTITFTGHREGGKINGTYVVDHQGSASENGTFTLRRLDSKGLGQDFDSASCPTDAEMNQ